MRLFVPVLLCLFSLGGLACQGPAKPAKSSGATAAPAPRKKASKEAAADALPDPGKRSDHVCLDVEEADLARVVLADIEGQAGVRIAYHGPALPVTIFIVNAHWKTAIEVICREYDLTLKELAGNLELVQLTRREIPTGGAPSAIYKEHEGSTSTTKPRPPARAATVTSPSRGAPAPRRSYG